jgi:hypothetical protein
MRGARAAATLALAFLSTLGAPPSLAGQRAWTLVEAPHVDLWFHGLAVVGFGGFGPLPLYDAGYAARMRRVKDSLGVSPTVLDRQAERLRSAFEQDSNFEVLHFVPLYFAAADREGMLEALRAVARQRAGIPSVTDARTRFGAAAVASVLRSPEERRLLGELVDALDREWRQFYGGYWAQRSERAAPRVAALQAEWDARFAPALAGYLSELRLDRGIVFLSPALGSDGRIFEGDPADRGDNLVAVRFPEADDAADLPLHAAMRELCYPAVRRALGEAGRATGSTPADRIGAERTSGSRRGAGACRARAPHRTRSALRITAASSASCSTAPSAGVSRPTLATTISAKLTPSPTPMLCSAMRRMRRLIAMASPTRAMSSTSSTMSAASAETAVPCSPIATPTVAAASAGASLIPSPTITTVP